MGSVKDLTVLKPAYENQPGIGRFTFSDRYSVFDWGEMPDQIVDKGRALAVMAAFNFEKLEDAEIKTHYEGLVNSDGKLVKFSDLKEGENGSDMMQVRLGVVYRPTQRLFVGENGKPQTRYDYSFFENNRGKIDNYLVPLEIIFRNGLPKGSSVFKRIEEAKAKEDSRGLERILASLDLASEPKPGDMLPSPVMSYTTKLEAGDRNLNGNEALKISGLTYDEFIGIAPTAMKVDDIITEQAKRTGFVHWDGKVEMISKCGDFEICDVIGTLDENRFTLHNDRFGGLQVSKEFLRQWYENNQPEFRKECDRMKPTGEGWQTRCAVKPMKLPPILARSVSDMYKAACNEYVERNIFDAPELEEVMGTAINFM